MIAHVLWIGTAVVIPIEGIVPGLKLRLGRSGTTLRRVAGITDTWRQRYLEQGGCRRITTRRDGMVAYVHGVDLCMKHHEAPNSFHHTLGTLWKPSPWVSLLGGHR